MKAEVERPRSAFSYSDRLLMSPRGYEATKKAFDSKMHIREISDLLKSITYYSRRKNSRVNIVFHANPAFLIGVIRKSISEVIGEERRTIIQLQGRVADTKTEDLSQYSDKLKLLMVKKIAEQSVDESDPMHKIFLNNAEAILILMKEILSGRVKDITEAATWLHFYLEAREKS